MVKGFRESCKIVKEKYSNVKFYILGDYEDRKKTVTIKTVSKFKMMASFIDVLSKFGPIDEEMKKKIEEVENYIQMM